MNPIVTGIGEVLWDRLPSGPRMGGAPANFACHAKSLGANAAIISQVGDDDPGHSLVEKLRGLGISTKGITLTSRHPTGTVVVELSDDGQPVFQITPSVAWDHLEVTPQLLEMVAHADAICFGSLGQRSSVSRQAIRELVSSVPETSLKVFDVNLREKIFTPEIIHHSLKLANICKLGDNELPLVSSMLGLSGDTRGRLDQLVTRYDLRLVVYTRGERGSLLCGPDECHEHAGLPVEVKDTIGAGDSFTAAVAMGLLQGWSLEEISRTANEVAAFVCSHEGAVPDLPDEIRSRFVW